MKHSWIILLALSGCGFGQTKPTIQYPATTQCKWTDDTGTEWWSISKECHLFPAEQTAPAQPQPYTWGTPATQPKIALLPCAPHCKFEVRTKREEEEPPNCRPIKHGEFTDQLCTCSDGWTVHWDKKHHGDCLRVTHSLYLSGQLLGTLEER